MVIEEDEVTRRAIGALLNGENFKTMLPGKAERGLEQVRLHGPCLVVISLPLADRSGADLRRRIDTLEVRTPTAFLGAGMEPLEEVLLPELDAGDYVAKPFRECELIARIGAALRPSAPRIQKKIRFSDVEVDIERRYIRRSGKSVKLTPNEYNLLLFFIRNIDQALTRDVILNEVWGYHCYPNTRTVDAHIVRLRRKLEPNPRAPRHFLTIHGVGYRFLIFPANAPPSEDSSTS